MATAAFIFAGILIYLETGKGRLTIECPRDDVAVQILRSGQVYDQLELHHGPNSTRIRAGQYEIKLVADTDQLLVKNGQFTLKRGADWVAKIVYQREPRVTAIVSPGQKESQSQSQVTRATPEAPVYGGKTLQEWFAAPQRDDKTIHEAVQAIDALRDDSSKEIVADGMAALLQQLQQERSPEHWAYLVRLLCVLATDETAREITSTVLETARRFPVDDVTRPDTAAWEAFGNASGALSIIDKDIVIAALIHELETATATGRLFATKALGRYSVRQRPTGWRVLFSPAQEKAVISALLKASHDSEEQVSWSALTAMMEVAPDDKQVRRRVHEVLSGTDPEAALQLTRWLEQRYPDRTEWLSAAKRNAHNADFEVAISFVDLLRSIARSHADDIHRAAAVAALAELLDDPSFGGQVGDFGTPSEGMHKGTLRVWLIDSLGTLGEKASKALPALERQASSSDAKVQEAAKKALKQIKEVAALEGGSSAP